MTKVITGDYRLVRDLNSKFVLNLIRLNGPISGADLAKQSGMQPSTIMNILRPEEKKGLIIKAGTGHSTAQGGRRPTLWEICGNYGYIFGIKIELTEIRGILIDVNARIFAQKALPNERGSTLELIESKIVSLIDQFMMEQKISRRNLLGLGIGVSGAVDSHNGTIIKTDLIKNNPVPLKSCLQKHFDFPIIIENDATAAAIGEQWFGNIKGVSDFIYTLLIIDQEVFGIGYGLVLDDHIYHGANMFAGESSPHRITIRDILNQIVDEFSELIEIGGRKIAKNDVDIDLLIDAALHQDPIAQNYFAKIAQILGKELAQIVDLLDPKIIVIGGEVSRVGDILLNPLRQAVCAHSNLSSIREVAFQVAQSPIGDSITIGAATLILQDIFHNPVISSKNYLS
jgi:predicted NBD/HSP70 family sugar kinase